MTENILRVEGEGAAVESHHCACCHQPQNPVVAQLQIDANNAETASRENLARFQAVFEGVETGIFVIDPETRRIVDANPVALEMVGATRDKIVGATCHKFVCPAEQGKCPVTDLGQTVDNSERVLLTVKGEKLSIIKTVKPVVMDGHRYLLESFLDITPRKRAEKALEERTAYLNTLVESSPLGIVVLDKDERIQLSNTAFERLFQYSREEMRGARLGDLLNPESLANEADYFTRECLRGRSVQFTSRRLRRDGALIDVEIYGVPLAIGEHFNGILGLYQDVSTRMRIEEEMAERHRLATLAAEVGLALTGTESLAQGLQKCADALVRNTGVVFTQFWITSQAGGGLEMQASVDFRLRGGADRGGFELARLERIVKTGVMELDREVEQASASQPDASRKLAFAGYPIKVRNQVLGVAAACASESFTDVALQSLESVVHSIAQFVESKRAEESLRESEDRFRTAFEAAPYGMCMTGLEGRFLHANAALAQMLGYSSDELLAGAWQQITHPDDLERSRKVGEQFRHSNASSIEIEKRYLHKKGSVVWARVKISVVKNSLGAPSHYITQIEDITRRKQADEAQAFLASLVESSHEAIAGTTPDGVVVSWNRGAVELFGYTAEEMLGKRASNTISPPEYGDEMPRILAKIRQKERVAAYETERIRKDGRRVSVSLTVSPVLDAQGNVTGAAYIARDITRRKLAEVALQSSEERYRDLFENASDLVYTFDLDLGITSLNLLAEQTIGYDREEATRMSLRQLVNPEHWGRIEQIISRLVAGLPPEKFELEIKAKGGRRVMLEINPRVIFRDSKAAEIQAIARDITGRDAAEIELRQAQKLESVGRLAAGIAHEINTPMQFVGDNVRFLQDSFTQLQAFLSKLRSLCNSSAGIDVPPALCAEFERLQSQIDTDYLVQEIPQAIVQTLDGVERVVTIVRAMKEFAHPEAKGMAHADINKALQNTITVARNELKYVADVETAFNDVPLVLCSISDINQVFLNLLVNAAHAIGDVVKDSGRKGTIRIETSVDAQMLLITVSDTGAGIPPEIRDRIFDPFFTTKEVGRGTGQGLAIARSVIDRHKGSLTFESEVGKGTTFRVSLPIDVTELRSATDASAQQLPSLHAAVSKILNR